MKTKTGTALNRGKNLHLDFINEKKQKKNSVRKESKPPIPKGGRSGLEEVQTQKYELKTLAQSSTAQKKKPQHPNPPRPKLRKDKTTGEGSLWGKGSKKQ